MTEGSDHRLHPLSHHRVRYPNFFKMESSISLEETNKIRISLGLKPLTEDKEPESKEDAAEKNYAKRREDEAKAKSAKYVYPVSTWVGTDALLLYFE